MNSRRTPISAFIASSAGPSVPSAVDVSSLMLEAKAAYVEKHGLPPSDWIFSRIELWARLGSRFPILTNFLLARRSARWLLDRLLGVSRHRLLPRVRRTSFTRRAARLGLNKPRPQQPGPRVVYFVDVYANYYDQELAEAVVAVLRQAEVNVFVPPRQRSSGMAALIVGDVDHARDQALANLRVLANAVRDGYTVVCSEPTAALMLRHEYVKLTEDLDAELVAANTMDVGQYLLGLDARGQLPRPHEPLHARVGYHQPCHLRALDVGTPGLELLRNVLELDVEFINRGCSGMGGTYGLARDRFWTSLRAGRGLLRRLRDDDIDIGATECGACRIQMEQGVAKRTLAPDQAAESRIRLESIAATALQRPQAAACHVVRGGICTPALSRSERSGFHLGLTLGFGQRRRGSMRQPCHYCGIHGLSNTGGGIRTHTGVPPQRILSPQRLP